MKNYKSKEMIMKKLITVLFMLCFKHVVFSQDIRVYHGERSESVFLRTNDKLENSSKEKVKIVRGTDGIVTIHILNPNPFFYNYEIKTEDVEIKDDYSDQFAELVKLINALPDLASPAANPFAARVAPIAVRVAAPAAPLPSFDQYQYYIQDLDRDLKIAKGYIETSDRPETVEEALKRIGNRSGFGFRAAIANIQTLPSAKGQFNSKTLEKELNDILEAAVTDGTFATSLGVAANPTLQSLYRSAFLALNVRLVTAVKEILKVTEKDRIMRFQVPVKENKQTNVKLVITKINQDQTVGRELLNEEIATVLPFYVRKRFEVVPVVNLVFQSDRQKFTLEDGIVTSTADDDAKFNIGAMALMNITSFGEFKEYGVGIGIGYSMQPSGKSSSFFVMPSISYRDAVRIGIGYGYNLSPVGLTNGAKVGAPLPEDITNLDDVIEYRRKPAVVITIAIAGIKF